MLVIAEERLARRVVWVLENAGHDVRWAPDVDVGLREATAGWPQVVVMNGSVNPRDVPRFTAQLDRAAPDVALVDISRQLGGEERPIEADAHLTQPFHADDLLAEVDRLTRR